MLRKHKAVKNGSKFSVCGVGGGGGRVRGVCVKAAFSTWRLGTLRKHKAVKSQIKVQRVYVGGGTGRGKGGRGWGWGG